MALNQTIQFSAVPVAALLAWLLNWRWVVLIGSLGFFLVWSIRRNLPESPLWANRGTGFSLSASWHELRRPPYARRTIMLVIFNISRRRLLRLLRLGSHPADPARHHHLHQPAIHLHHRPRAPLPARFWRA